MATSLIPLPEVERLSPRVLRILGGNPGKFTLQGTNTYLIGTGHTRLLLDTGEGKPVWLSHLKSVLSSEDASISKAILTHWHHDHTHGVPDLLSISPSTKVFKNQPDDGQLDIKNGAKFEVEGATLRAFHCPGHTVDHMAMILEEEDAMFTGDNVLGQGTSVFEDLATYMDSLEQMSHQFNGRAYPAHGPVIEDGRETILEYIRHRQEREQQVLDVLLGNAAKKNSEGDGWKSMEIVKIVYKDVPETLHGAAERGVIQILHKLEKDNKVTLDDLKDTWCSNSKAAL